MKPRPELEVDLPFADGKPSVVVAGLSCTKMCLQEGLRNYVLRQKLDTRFRSCLTSSVAIIMQYRRLAHKRIGPTRTSTKVLYFLGPVPAGLDLYLPNMV